MRGVGFVGAGPRARPGSYTGAGGQGRPPLLQRNNKNYTECRRQVRQEQSPCPTARRHCEPQPLRISKQYTGEAIQRIHAPNPARAEPLPYSPPSLRAQLRFKFRCSIRAKQSSAFTRRTRQEQGPCPTDVRRRHRDRRPRPAVRRARCPHRAGAVAHAVGCVTFVKY